MATAPVDAPVTQEFGENPQNYSRFGLNGHEGRDYGCPTGTPVHAALSGVVGIAQYWPSTYGNVVILHHPDGSGTIYGHLQSFNVGQGQSVNEGDVLGWSNNTGNSSGPHLHFGYQPQYMSNLQNGYWGCADPRILLTQGPTVDPQQLTQARRAYANAQYALLMLRPASPAELPQWDGHPTNVVDDSIYASQEYHDVWGKWIPGYPEAEVQKKIAARATTAFDIINHYVALSKQGDSGAAQKLAQIKQIVN